MLNKNGFAYLKYITKARLASDFHAKFNYMVDADLTSNLFFIVVVTRKYSIFTMLHPPQPLPLHY